MSDLDKETNSVLADHKPLQKLLLKNDKEQDLYLLEIKIRGRLAIRANFRYTYRTMATESN